MKKKHSISIYSGDSKVAVILGEQGSGKTSLFLRLVKGTFPAQDGPGSYNYVPGVCEPVFIDVDLPEPPPGTEKAVQKRKQEPIQVTLMDIMGRTHDCDGLPALMFAPYDPAVVFICFSVVRSWGGTVQVMDSLEQWLEVSKHHFVKGTRYVLVACQVDSRETMSASSRIEFVSPDQGLTIAQRIGAAGYIECSAKTGEGIDAIQSEIASSLWNLQYKSRWSTHWESLKGQCIVC
ncbi:P-loop containing nucleoside triphosphate hydrolase protein [Pluteus cervinus]|uniref:P-loop containing nucleoside triphosphate hydrolase protein n=1 Tax=Pluteus cervinus TaxID=181527 RepID=A0ACD3ARF7_9AGAR|nr:P-loop containing nucleoside triphosphate hydrolase protein [Pluteus cervinus]